VTAGRALSMYNSLGRAVEEFRPADPANVRMYSCGPTVYSYAHLGNMRAYVCADVLRRVLEWKGAKVRQVVNITDVGHLVADTDDAAEDKLEVAARNQARSVLDVAEQYTTAFLDDLAALNVKRADAYPRATEYVPKMVEFAAVLEQRGVTYRLDSGLYFDTSKSPHYGRLALMDAEGQREGARVDSVEGKRAKTDFAIWRTETPGERRLLRWDSPWGWGAPGWHLECSVMSIDLLGPHFDLHTVGVDHRELHHVNEIAQSEAYLADGRPWVPFWVHNEFLLFGSAKMSKSAGAVTRLADIVERGYPPVAYRYLVLTSHYRSQAEFTLDALDAGLVALRRLVARTAALPVREPTTLGAALDGADPALAKVLDSLDAALSDDLSSPRAIALVHQAVRDPELSDDAKAVVVAAADFVLGLGLASLTEEDLRGGPAPVPTVSAEHVEALIAERAAARKSGDWARADAIRDELAAAGVKLLDDAQGTSWTYA
jgi:cysteinyl-tRNA synthetase